MADEQKTGVGRVLRASTAGFVVGYRVKQLSQHSFGCLVKAQPLATAEAVYGLIYDINIDDDQLIRRMVMTESPPPAVIADQRQNRMLPLEMSVLTIGYRDNDGRVFRGMPPRPPLNLDPVELCVDQDEVCDFTGRLGYLRLILRAPAARVPVDQLLVAHVVDVYQKRGKDEAWAMRAVNELIELLRSNYDLLIPTLEALSDALPDLSHTEMPF